MKALAPAPNLVQQVCDAIVGEIVAGALGAGERVIQEQVAKALGVSRQPVQQALLLLRQQGMLTDAPGRGLVVAALAPQQVQHMYEMREVIEGLAARGAAEHGAERAARLGPPLIEAGRKAVESGSVPKLVAADMKFHQFVYSLSPNPLVAPAMAVHWTDTQRVMGEVLVRDETPRDIWDQHEALLAAIAHGDAKRAEALAREHIAQAGRFMVERLRREQQGAAVGSSRGTRNSRRQAP